MSTSKVIQWPCGRIMYYSQRSTNLTLVLRLLTWCPKHRIVTVLVGEEKQAKKGGSHGQPRVPVSV